MAQPWTSHLVAWGPGLAVNRRSRGRRSLFSSRWCYRQVFVLFHLCCVQPPQWGGCPCCACRVAWASGHHRGRGPGGCGEPASRTHPAVPWFPGWQLEARLRCCSWAPRRPQGRETDFGEPVLRLLPTPPPLPTSTSSAGARAQRGICGPRPPRPASLRLPSRPRQLHPPHPGSRDLGSRRGSFVGGQTSR